MFKISKTAAIRSPWFIGWILLLIVVIGMNVTMILISLRGSPGIVTEDFYERGQTYDKELNQRIKSHPGWTSEYKYYGELYVNEESQVAFKVADKEGKAINADQVTLFIYRPSNKNDDFKVKLNSLDGIHYSNNVTFPLKGVWDTVVEIKKANEVRNFAKRLTIYQR